MPNGTIGGKVGGGGVGGGEGGGNGGGGDGGGGDGGHFLYWKNLASHPQSLGVPLDFRITPTRSGVYSGFILIEWSASFQLLSGGGSAPAMPPPVIYPNRMLPERSIETLYQS